MRRRPWRAAGALAGLRFELPRGFEYFVAYDEYEPELVAALARLVEPGFVCADIGANVGVLTLHLARCAGPRGSVVAFEAAGENVALLRKNVNLNSELESRIVIEHAAVTAGGQPTIELYAARGGGHAGWTTSEEFAARVEGEEERRDTVIVRAVALDNYFGPGARLDVVKIDIEGGEGQALSGMRRLLREARPTIVLEFHREVGWPAIPELLDAGYRLEHLSGELCGVPSGPDEVPYQLLAIPPGRSGQSQL